MLREFDGDRVEWMADGVWVWCDMIVGQFLLICSSAFPEVSGEVVKSFFT